MLERGALAEAELAAAEGTIAGRGRIAAFQSVMLNIAIPAIKELAREAPRLRCEVIEAEPEDSIPSLALGDIDLALGDEWQDQPRRLPAGVDRHDLMRDRVRVVLPTRHPVARAHPDAVPLEDLADEVWASGHVGMGWEDLTERTCRQLGGFSPDIRHRANDASVSLALVSQGLAVTLLPELPLPPRYPGVVARAIAGPPIERVIFAATRSADAVRPSTGALLAAVGRATAALSG